MKTAAEYIKIEKLHPWENNPRKNNHAVDEIVESIKRFGFSSPIIARREDNTIIAGHTRYKAALKLGLKEVPVRYMDLSVVDSQLLAIADNKLNERADWDEDLLEKVLSELADEDLSGLGFDDEELDKIIAENFNDLTEDQEPEELPEDYIPVSQIGEIYQLGEHRLMCGDCRDFVDQSTNLIFDPMWQDIGKFEFEFGKFKNILAFTSGGRFSDVISILNSPTWVFVWDCVSSWYTPNRPLARGKFCLWYGDIDSYNQKGGFYKTNDTKKRTVSNTRGSYEYMPDPRGRILSDVYSNPITKLHSESQHKYSKPLDWIKCLIGNTCTDSVYDPFAGSGVTLIASEIAGITWEGCELDPNYCDVIRKRWASFAKENNLDIGDGLE